MNASEEKEIVHNVQHIIL